VPDEEGVPYKETLEGLLGRARTPERRAEIEAELQMPTFPMEVEYLWNDYLRLRSRKVGNEMGVVPIEWTDFHAFMAVFRRHYDPWELQTLEAIDRVYLAQMRKPNGGPESA